MSEVTKLYENAGVKPINFAKQGAIDFTNTIEIDGKRYPDFTAEKQLELIKLLAKNDNVYITFYPSDNTYNIRYRVAGFYDGSVMGDREATSVDFGEALAGIINNLWQDLTEEEKQQVKGVLE